MNYLIIAAGGNGERMKLGYNKIFAKLLDKPIIYWTLKVFSDNSTIDRIIISAKKEDFNRLNQIIKKYKFSKIFALREANHSRQDSTFLVLQWLQGQVKNEDMIGVHNAVNPFVMQSEIETVYQQAKEFGGALLASPAKDTVKISDDNNLVAQTPVRKYCWYAQTPQVSTYGNLWKAFVRADEEKFLGTDDTQLLERVGVRVKIVPCSNRNFKITFNEDLILANKIMASWRRENV